MGGLASPATLVGLWMALKGSLLDRLTRHREPSAELLGVARRFLKDNGQLGPPDEAARKDLEEMHRLYRKALLAALQKPTPSSTLLAEARTYYSQQQPAEPTPAAAPLEGTGVPFPTTKQ